MVVLDASVIIKWFVQEPGTKEALIFKEEHQNQEKIIVSPVLAYYEIFNILTVVKELTLKEIREILDIILELKIVSAAPTEEQTIIAAQCILYCLSPET